MPRQERILGYDAIKALAAFLVVLYHVGMVDFGYREGEYYYPTVVQVIWLFCACGVPLFYMVNGALTVNRHYDLKKTLTKSARLVFAGVFWAIVVMCIYAIRDHNFTSFAVNRIGYYWFLFSLAVIYLINYALTRLPRWCRWTLVAVLLIVPFGTNLAWDLVILNDPGTSLTEWRHGAFTLYGVVYLYLGDYLRGRELKKRLILAIGTVGLFLLSVEAMAVVNRIHAQFEGGNYCFPTYGALLLSVAIFVSIKSLNTGKEWLRRLVTFLGDNALGIYIFHLILMIIVGGMLPSLQSDFTWHPIMAILIAILYTLLSAVLSHAIRHSRLAFLLKL